jgi:hypothetical protein
VQGCQRGAAGHATPGVGPGPSVGSAVARLHGGTLALRESNPGLRAVLRVPANAARDGGASMPRPDLHRA